MVEPEIDKSLGLTPSNPRDAARHRAVSSSWELIWGIVAVIAFTAYTLAVAGMTLIEYLVARWFQGLGAPVLAVSILGWVSFTITVGAAVTFGLRVLWTEMVVLRDHVKRRGPDA